MCFGGLDCFCGFDAELALEGLVECDSLDGLLFVALAVLELELVDAVLLLLLLLVFAGGVNGLLAGFEPLGLPLDVERFDAAEDPARASLGDIAGALYGSPAALAATAFFPLNSPGRPVAATEGAPWFADANISLF